MELTKQVVSLELAKKLKELGVPQESLFWHCHITYPKLKKKIHFFRSKEERRIQKGGPVEIICSAFTVAELGDLLPDEFISTVRENKKYHIHGHYSANRESMTYPSDTEADARAKMLIYLLTNKLITL